MRSEPQRQALQEEGAPDTKAMRPERAQCSLLFKAQEKDKYCRTLSRRRVVEGEAICAYA